MYNLKLFICISFKIIRKAVLFYLRNNGRDSYGVQSDEYEQEFFLQRKLIFFVYPIYAFLPS